MRDMESLCKLIMGELDKVVENGFSPNNLESTFKFIDILKDIKNMEYWDVKEGYYRAVLDDMRGGYSERRDSMGRYARDYDRNDGYPENYDRDSSYRGRRSGEHYVRGHYSRDDGREGYSEGHYDRYMDSKQSYRSSGSKECKQRMMDTLEDYMDSFAKKMNDMLRDSDCEEERETIQRYLNKIKSIA